MTPLPRPNPWEASPRGKFPRANFPEHLEAREVGISRPNPRGIPGERTPTSRGRDNFLARSLSLALRRRFSLVRPGRRPASSRELPPASSGETPPLGLLRRDASFVPPPQIKLNG
uniref:Uncharacterized protein n=1 Tax=Oryza meridionalis TaxID=40149 RepID=A0A0E0DY94_9ORYZ